MAEDGSAYSQGDFFSPEQPAAPSPGEQIANAGSRTVARTKARTRRDAVSPDLILGLQGDWEAPAGEVNACGNTNIVGAHRYCSPFIHNGEILVGKMTVKEFARPSEGNRIYSVEALDIVKPAGNWVASISEDRRNYTPQAGFEETLRQKIEEIKVESELRSSPVQA